METSTDGNGRKISQKRRILLQPDLKPIVKKFYIKRRKILCALIILQSQFKHNFLSRKMLKLLIFGALLSLLLAVSNLGNEVENKSSRDKKICK